MDYTVNIQVRNYYYLFNLLIITIYIICNDCLCSPLNNVLTFPKLENTALNTAHTIVDIFYILQYYNNYYIQYYFM